MPSPTLDSSVVRDRVSRAVPVIEKVLEVTGTPGLSIAVILHGEVAHVSHHGYRDVERRLNPDSNTRYAMNSMTKAMVAALAGMLADEGLLNLDDKIISFLPDFHSQNPEVQQNCTITDFLSHRSGITNFDPFWLGEQNHVLLDKGQVLKAFGTLKPYIPFRTGFIYNNWGYDIVGQILEKITNQSLGELLSTRIFVPLGMSRTSTNWNSSDDNIMNSYAVLSDLRPVLIHRPTIGEGTLMEAAGGIKTTTEDLIKLYTAFVNEASTQFGFTTSGCETSVFKRCKELLTGYTHLPRPSFREQAYAAGWVRAQLPGQLGRISNNPLIAEQPIVGKGSEPRLDIYHHGSMPGSTTCVHLFLESGLSFFVLQNSIAPIDTADFIGQLLVETIFDVEDKNDYVELSLSFTKKALNKMNIITNYLESNRRPGTKPKELECYTGQYWNSAGNFFLNVAIANNELTINFQGMVGETYALKHYQDDIFSWVMSYNELSARGRYIADYEASFYLFDFQAAEEGQINRVQWAWDPNFPNDGEVFFKDSKGELQNTNAETLISLENARLRILISGEGL